MEFNLFNQLYSEAIESPSLELYVGERGWQEWMDGYDAKEIADILSTIYSLANSTLAESRVCSRAEFARKFGIPIRTIEDWDSGKRIAPLYVKKLIDYAIFSEGVKDMTHTENEILSLVKELDLEPDMLDIWKDKDGNLLLEGRGIQPTDATEWIAYVDNGTVTFR